MFNFIIKLAIGLSALVLLTACGGGGGGGGGTSANKSNTTASTLTWTAPTLFEDGSTASPADIGGYKIYRGTTEDNMVLVATIEDTSVTEFNIQSLGSGAYYFSVSAYDSYGVESKATTPILISVS